MFDYREMWFAWSALALAVVVGLVWVWFQLKVRYFSVPLRGITPTFPFGNVSLFQPDFLQGFGKLYAAVDPANGLGSVWVFATQTFLVTRADDIKKLFATSPHRNRDARAVHTEMFLGAKSLTLLNDDEWSVHRRLIQKAFQYTRFSEMTVELVASCSNLVDYLSERLGQEVDLSLLLKMMTLDAIGLTAFGYRFNSIQGLAEGRPVNRVAEAFEYLSDEWGRRMYSANPFVLSYSLPTASNRKHKACRQIVRDTINEIVEHRLRERDTDKAAPPAYNDLLQAMLDVAVQGTDQLNVDALTDELITMLFAGYDTTSIAVTYAVYELIKHPEELAKVRAEVATVIGERDPVFDDVAQLQYCSWVIKEALRLYPPAPLTTRSLREDLELGTKEKPVVIPKDAFIFIAPWFSQKDPHNFPDEPERFMPERFRETPHLGAWIPFSGGLRNCVGQKFAMLEATVTLAMLCRQFAFRLAPGYVMQPVLSGVVQKPKDGLQVIVQQA